MKGPSRLAGKALTLRKEKGQWEERLVDSLLAKRERLLRPDEPRQAFMCSVHSALELAHRFGCVMWSVENVRDANCASEADIHPLLRTVGRLLSELKMLTPERPDKVPLGVHWPLAAFAPRQRGTFERQ